ncbi:hypothetical protein NDU88_005730 [Pleurodeles waltl]|uniref:Uncharacterized protein n=1 Tax=Pleurodeles waltl TaxID=8319 RepID=A0AAV7L5B4_PLEWA|nr:hypothetical protein NDU88_005730 [Pleurodeles waltl]
MRRQLKCKGKSPWWRVRADFCDLGTQRGSGCGLFACPGSVCFLPLPCGIGSTGNVHSTKFGARRSMGEKRPRSSVPVGLTLKCVHGGLTAMRSCTLCIANLYTAPDVPTTHRESSRI